MLPYLLQGLGLGFAAVASPGPLITFLISLALRHGFRRAWPAAFAPLVSDGPIILISLLALSQIPAWLQRSLNFASGLFILYLAFGAWNTWRSFARITTVVDKGQENQTVLKAALMNLINPFPYAYWSLVNGPILIAGWRQAPAYGLSFLIVFYGVMIGGYLITMGIFSTARGLGDRISKIMLGLSAIALVCFGLLQLYRGLLG